MFSKFPAIFLLPFVVVGIVTSRFVEISSLYYFLFFILFILGGIIFYYVKKSNLSIILFLLALGSFCSFHYSARFGINASFQLKEISKNKLYLDIFGTVAEWPLLSKNGTDLILSVDSLIGDKVVTHLSGYVLLKISDTTTSLQRGDRLNFMARIYPLPEQKSSTGFDYRRYLTHKEIGGICYLSTDLSVKILKRSEFAYYALIDKIRSAISQSLRKNLSENSSGLASGFLIGDTRSINKDIYSLFRDSGTLHLLAVSGSNVALVIFFVLIIIRPFRPKIIVSTLTLIIAVVIFSSLSYGEPSVIRASLMASLVLLGRLLQRKQNYNNIIAVAALIILLIDPSQLFSVGFQLSFVTAWGLIIAVPIIMNLQFVRESNRVVRWFIMLFSVSLTAQLFSAPLIGFYFYEIPLISVLANMIIVPLVSIAVIGVEIMLALDFIFPLLGYFTGTILEQLYQFIIMLLHSFHNFSPGFIEVSRSDNSIKLLAYIFLFYLLLILFLKSFNSVHVRRYLAVTAIVSINLFLIDKLLLKADNIQIIFHNTAGGVSAVMKDDYTNQSYLILTSLKNREYKIDEKILSPILFGHQIEKLEFIIASDISYSVLDDLLRLAEQYKIEKLYISDQSRAGLTDQYNQIKSSLNRNKIVYFDENSVFEDRDSKVRNYLKVSSLGIELNVYDQLFLIASTLKNDHFNFSSDNLQTYLIIGEKWSPSPVDWIKLQSIGYERIICSEIKQYVGNIENEIDPFLEEIPDDFITNLSKNSPFKLSLKN